jgi:hypothetical protein
MSGLLPDFIPPYFLQNFSGMFFLQSSYRHSIIPSHPGANDEMSATQADFAGLPRRQSKTIFE